MNHQGRGWRWGVRPAIVALAGVVVGYLTNVVSAGNHSVAAVAGFVFAVVAFLGLVWWDSHRQPGTMDDSSVLVKQHFGTVHDSSVTAVETNQPIRGRYSIRQRLGLVKHSHVTGIRNTSPSSSRQQP